MGAKQSVQQPLVINGINGASNSDSNYILTLYTRDHEQKEDNIQQSIRHHAYMNHEPKQSLLKNYVVWLLKHASLALLISILQPVLMVMFIMFSRPIYHFLGFRWTSFMFLAIILPSLYSSHFVLGSMSIEYHIDALYTVIPLYLSIIFKDAIIVASHLRYNINEDAKQKYEKLRELSCFPCKDRMITYLSRFLKNYSVWGKTLRRYQPYGSFMLSRPQPDVLESCQELFKKIFPFENNTNYKKYYETTDRICRYFMMVLAGILSVLPTVFFMIHHFKHKEFGYSSATAVIGLLFLGMTSWAINKFIEIIFYQLNKYYKYMKGLTRLIELVPDQCNEFNDDPIEMSYSPRARNSRHKEAISISQNESIIEDRIFLFEGATDGAITKANELNLSKSRSNSLSFQQLTNSFKRHQYKYNGNNSMVWFENWSRIEHIACVFFAKGESVVFAIFTTLFACTICGLYYYVNHDLLNTITISIFGGFLYTLMVLIRLVLFAMKISSLEDKQIELIRCQQTYLNHKIIKSKQKSKNKDDHHGDDMIRAGIDDLKRAIQDIQHTLQSQGAPREEKMTHKIDNNKHIENAEDDTKMEIEFEEQEAIHVPPGIKDSAVQPNVSAVPDESTKQNSNTGNTEDKRHESDVEEEKKMEGIAKDDNKMEEFDNVEEDMNVELAESIITYLDLVVMHIQFRSLSPKIAGVKLDKALVSMVIGAFVTFAGASITYLLGRLK